jgi:hypothetical protein
MEKSYSRILEANSRMPSTARMRLWPTPALRALIVELLARNSECEKREFAAMHAQIAFASGPPSFGENDIPIFQRFVEIIEQRFHIPAAKGVCRPRFTARIPFSLQRIIGFHQHMLPTEMKRA